MVYEITRDIEPSVIASLDHMMEILSKELSESEKMVYLPVYMCTFIRDEAQLPILAPIQ